MIILIVLLFVLSMISFVLQIGMIKNFLIQLGFYVILALGLYFSYPYAIEQSYTTFKTATENQEIVSNLLVIQIVECIIGLLFCIFLIRDFYKERTLTIFRFFKLFPGIILVPSMFYLQSFVFLNVPGLDFQILAIIIAVLVPSLVLGTVKLMNCLIPEYDLRLELKFIIHILQLILSVVISIKLFALPVNSSLGELSYLPFLVFALLVLVMAGIGMYWHNRQMKKILKSITK
ncbi:hypothetical protein [Marinifilum caeruleilacunae]|uniref:Uncharacterized protein n=1 Tax=Marinifilum caeruleilacunae TaxID=2499076 RepID=A0ABX1WQH4_9BACT|nr:hypothetical protein [Marinifilum caeruleilacunae]NOU58335.1 hypothetical protein [Marinifilum caeruleilacunae]